MVSVIVSWQVISGRCALATAAVHRSSPTGAVAAYAPHTHRPPSCVVSRTATA